MAEALGSATDGEAPQTPSEGSAVRGVAAALVAAAAAVPLTAIAGIVCLLLERMLLGKVVGHEVDRDSLRQGGTAMMGASVVAVATGLFGGGAAATVALMLVKDAARRLFSLAASALFGVLAAALWLWLRHRDPSGVAGNAFYVLLGWVGAVAGLLAAAAVDADREADAPAAAESEAGAPMPGS